MLNSGFLRNCWKGIVLGCFFLPGALRGDDLLAGTEVLLASLAATEKVDADLWHSAQQVLAEWERSTELDLARQKYVDILWQVAEGILWDDLDGALLSDYRSHLEKALRLDLTDSERGRLLYLLGVLSVPPVLGEPSGAARSYLLQAADLLQGMAPADAVALELAKLFLEEVVAPWKDDFEHISQRSFTEAGQWLERAIQVSSGDEATLAEAERLLQRVRQTQLHLEIGSRYLPYSEVSFTVWTRNILNLQIEVLDDSAEPVMLVPQEISTPSAHARDWQRVQISLGDLLPSGRWKVRVSFEQESEEVELLITQLELLTVEDSAGRLHLRSVDAMSGQPVPASILFRNGSGEIVHQAALGEIGAGVFDAEQIGEWESLLVQSLVGPAVFKRNREPMDDSPSLLLPFKMEAAVPGQLVEWLMWSPFSSGFSATEDRLAGSKLIVPEAGEVPVQVLDNAGEWLRLGATLPSDSRKGPVLFATDNNQRVLTAVADVTEYPFLFEIEAPRMDHSSALFASGQALTVGLRARDAAFTETWQAPPFFALRIVALDRSGDGNDSARKPLPVEQLVDWETSNSGILRLQLPELELYAPIAVYRIEVADPRNQQVLATKIFAITGYYGQTHLRPSRTLGRVGDSFTIDWDASFWGDGQEPLRRGSLVVVRETWESRYIHRRKGTYISEEAYFSLPERSLLGSARTDYSLDREGYQEEEVVRLDISAMDLSGSVSLQPDRPGRYRVEFVQQGIFGGRTQLLVMPRSSQDFRALRSTSLQLNGQSTADGYNILLLDRSPGTVYWFFEDINGNVLRSEVETFSSPGHLLHIENADAAAIGAVLGVIVRESGVEFSRIHLRPPVTHVASIEPWNQPVSQPGSTFDWQLELFQKQDLPAIYWGLLPPGSATKFASELQRQLNSPEWLSYSAANFASLEQQLPFARPASRMTSPAAMSFVPAQLQETLVDTLFRHYPELLENQPAGLDKQLRVAVLSGSGECRLQGLMPVEQLDLELVALAGAQTGPMIGRRVLSTERPILMSLESPKWTRVGDQLELLLQLESRMTSLAEFDFQWNLSPQLEQLMALPERFSVSPGGSFTTPIPVQIVDSGSAQIKVLIDADPVTSELGVEFLGFKPTSAPTLDIRVLRSGMTLPTLPPDQEAQLKEIWSGTQLDEFVEWLWRHLRLPYAEENPLLATLLDVSLSADATANSSSIAGHEWVAQLTRLQTADGGWALRAGAGSDPWWTAAIVLALNHLPSEGHSAAAAEALKTAVSSAQQYLQGVMLSPDRPLELRLLALQALPEVGDDQGFVRPTRLQARVFLELFQELGRMEPRALAIFAHIARTFAFEEEFEVLLGRMLQVPAMDWTAVSASSAYLAVSGLPNHLEFRLSLLDVMVGEIGAMAQRGHLMGGLTLLRLFFASRQAGDMLELDAAQLTHQEAILELRSGLLWPLEEESSLPLPLQVLNSVDGRSGWRLLASIGGGWEPQSVQELSISNTDVRAFRHFDEATLLAGPVPRRMEFSAEDSLRRGDLLEVVHEFELNENQAYLEVILPRPAGLVSREHPKIEYLPVPEIGINSTVSDSPAGQKLLLQSAAAGRYRVVQFMEARWAGRFIWPPMLCRDPISGAVSACEDNISSIKVER